jgi:itaconate CoA-transferase
MQFGRTYEEFEVGAVYKHWPGKTVTEYDDHLFCLLTMNHHPLHMDSNYAENTTDFGKNVVVGNYIYSLLLGMSVPDVSGKAIANLEIESLRHVAPTFHGDTIYGETTVLDKTPSKSKNDRGIVYVETKGYKQDGTLVCVFRRKVMVPTQQYVKDRGGDQAGRPKPRHAPGDRGAEAGRPEPHHAVKDRGKLPLEGITVVAVEQVVAAPFASRQLADLGARVIKIERPGEGDFARAWDTTVHGQSSYFVWCNRSKESLALDLKTAEGTRVLNELLARADVFLHNLAPGAIERLGFGTSMLRKRHPRLIVCTISGYGSTGPYRGKKAYDLLMQCETGLVSVTGSPDTPSRAGISAADIAAGMYAYSGILTALYRRERTGEGSALEVSLFESLAEWMSAPAYFTAYGGTPPRRSGASHPFVAPYGPHATGDGAMVFLAVQNEREWKRFCETVLRKPELTRDARFCSNTQRTAHREELDAELHGVFQTLSAEELIRRLDDAGVANARMNSIPEFLAHPQLAARGRWRDVETPEGLIQALIPPVTISGIEPVMGAVPDVGQHTEAILREFGVGVTPPA